MSSHSSSKFWVIIPAAGIGSRMGLDKPKQYLEIENKTILEHTIACFLEHPSFNEVYVGLSKNDVFFERCGLSKKDGVKIFCGGKERADTVLNGLEHIADVAKPDDWIWVHDAARPCLTVEDINKLIVGLRCAKGGLVLGVPISDTLKRISSEPNDLGLLNIQETVDRSGLWRAMTPQIFRFEELREALRYCCDSEFRVTDEASALEKIGSPASMVQGSEQNIKVTLPADLIKVQDYLRCKKTVLSEIRKQNEVDLSVSEERFPKIGTGFDVHAFGDGDAVILGGVKVPHKYGLVAHSDGDVLLHAIMDALLGALALGDIGKHFPDTDDRWKGANSRTLLKAVKALITEQGYKVGNIDSTIIAQAPKMADYIVQMQANIAEDLELEKSSVGVKATTTEKLGFTGRNEGIACQASVILIPVLSSAQQ